MAKLAIAVAIIKSKPPGRSGRQHAEKLAASLKQQDEAWKAKAQDLKEEVLRLRQELLLTKLRSNARSSAVGGRGDEGEQRLLSQDPQDVQLSESDSGCGTSNNTQTLIDPVDAQVPWPRSTMPPSSICPSLLTFPNQKGTMERALSSTQFLQHLTGLRRLGSSSLTVDWDGALVWDSVFHLLSSVTEAFKEVSSGKAALPQPALLLEASHVSAQALEQREVHQKPPALYSGQVEDSLKELIDLLVSNSQLNKFAVQETLTECLISLGGSGVLRSVLIRLLLSHIIHLAQDLWNACQTSSEGQQQQQQLDWFRYHNSFYLFWLLEHLIQMGPPRASAELRDLQAQLDRSILPLSDEFPLFTLYMWRIGGLLNPTGNTGT
ncbi:meiosis-specific protein MEI4 isoform X2 [Hoplias malabaricus]